MISRYRCLPALGSAVLLVACADTDEVVLRTFDQSLSLTYSCSTFEPIATSAIEFELVDEMAMTGYRHAMANGMAAEAAVLPALRENGDLKGLERAVANYFCENREAIDSPRPRILKRPVAVDSVAPNFTSAVLVEQEDRFTGGSRRVSLASFRGKFVVLHPVAVYCRPCVSEHNKLIKLSADLPENVVILGMITETGVTGISGASSWLDFAGGLPPFPIVHDIEDRIGSRYGMRLFPQLYVIAPSGRVAYHHLGEGGADELPEVLSRLGIAAAQPAS